MLRADRSWTSSPDLCRPMAKRGSLWVPAPGASRRVPRRCRRQRSSRGDNDRSKICHSCSDDRRVYQRLVLLLTARVSPPPARSSTRIWHSQCSIPPSSCAAEEMGRGSQFLKQDNYIIKRSEINYRNNYAMSIDMPTSKKNEQKKFQRYQICVDELLLRQILIHVHLLRRRCRCHHGWAGFVLLGDDRESTGQSGRPKVVYYADWSLISIAIRPSCVYCRLHKRKIIMHGYNIVIYK